MTCYARVTEAGEFVVPAALVRALGVRPGKLLVLDQEAFRGTIKRPFTVDQFPAERAAEVPLW